LHFLIAALTGDLLWNVFSHLLSAAYKMTSEEYETTSANSLVHAFEDFVCVPTQVAGMLKRVYCHWHVPT